MKRKSIIAAAALIGIGPATLFGQEAQQGRAIASSDVLSQISMFNYREGPKSDLLFRGTPIAAAAEGKAQVEYQDGNAEIKAKVANLPEPSSLGPYTVYVLWALTPDGRATNQGVLVGPEGGKGAMDTLHGASQFALVVAAEPHFAVTVPSTMIALYNVADDVKGEESKVTTLTERADYANLAPIASVDRTRPPEVVQARYALAIATAAGAERFSPEAFGTASDKLAAAETALLARRGSERRTAPGLAREAVIAGEDARRSALLASTEADADQERRAAARAATDAANTSASQAATVAAAAAAAATERATAAERSRSATAAAVAAADAAAAARSELLARLNSALPTRESERGLISEIGGAHFATGTAELNATASEGLARFSGIVASYPGLRFKIEGHTDSTGSVATNDELSLRRAMSARDYMISQGVTASSIDVEGFGFSMPVGDNATRDGRAHNRRVEIVVSGGPFAAR